MRDRNPESTFDADRPTTNHVAGLVAGVLVLAAVNHVAGRLGLMLALPPGFATAVFPPSGIALAALLIWGNRLWPGILLGSLSFNLQQAFASSPEATLLGSLPVAASIAFGSTLQAVAGAALLRRFARAPSVLILERDVFTLLMTAPASCLVGASWGVATLSLAGFIVGGSLGYTWFTWWVGDVIGVLIFTPLVMTLCARPRATWQPRLLSVGAPLCIAFALVIMVYIVVGEREKESIQAEFERHTETVDRALYRDLQSYQEVLWSIRSYFAGSQSVDSEEFRTFVHRSLSAYPGIKALSWNPRISGSDRADYEARISRELGKPFEIRMRSPQGALVRSKPRDEHVVVQFIQPIEHNAAALGFDVFADPVRRRALERARDTGEPAASERIDLVQDPGEGFLLFMPVYATDATPATLAERRTQWRGAAVAVVRVATLTGAALSPIATDGIVMTMWDETDAEGGRLLGRYPPDASPDGDPAIAQFEVVVKHEIGGRDWVLRFLPTPEFLATQRTWQAWIVLAGGLTFTGLLGAILLVITGRAALEIERRQEVAEINHRLERTNEELARFAYAASHDLRSPLRGIGQLAEFLAQDHGASLPDDARMHLAMIQARIARMMQLLEDLLQFSRVGWLEQEPELIDTVELVSELVALVPESDQFEVALQGMPELRTFRVPLAQVLRNLLANAIKHHDRKQGRIEIGCSDTGQRYEFTVRDDGPGIPLEHRERVFEMFQTLRPREDIEGSGMGLALVRKIVTNRGGEVTIESEGPRGTTIRFSWPKLA